MLRLDPKQRYFLDGACEGTEYFHLCPYIEDEILKVPDFDGPGCYIALLHKGIGRTGNLLFDVKYIGCSGDKKLRLCMTDKKEILKAKFRLGGYVLTTCRNRPYFSVEKLRRRTEKFLKYLMPPPYEGEDRWYAEKGRREGNTDMISVSGSTIYRLPEKYRSR